MSFFLSIWFHFAVSSSSLFANLFADLFFIQISSIKKSQQFASKLRFLSVDYQFFCTKEFNFPFHLPFHSKNFHRKMFSTIINRFFHFYFLLFFDFSMRWGHSRWRFSEGKFTHRIQTNVLKCDPNPNCEDWVIFRHRDKLSGALCSHFFTNALHALFSGLQKQRNFPFGVFSVRPALNRILFKFLSCSCSIQNRSLLMVEAKKNAIRQEKMTVTHAFSIKTSFFSRWDFF